MQRNFALKCPLCGHKYTYTNRKDGAFLHKCPHCKYYVIFDYGTAASKCELIVITCDAFNGWGGGSSITKKAIGRGEDGHYYMERFEEGKCVSIELDKNRYDTVVKEWLMEDFAVLEKNYVDRYVSYAADYEETTSVIVCFDSGTTCIFQADTTDGIISFPDDLKESEWEKAYGESCKRGTESKLKNNKWARKNGVSWETKADWKYL